MPRNEIAEMFCGADRTHAGAAPAVVLVATGSEVSICMDAAKVLAAKGVLANVAALGSEAALTGPVSRGDAEVLAGHLSALDPEARAAYRALLAPLLELARAQGASDALLAPIQALAEE